MEGAVMLARRMFHWHRHDRSRVAQSYLLPPVVAELVFDPTLRRAGDILRGG
jgi:hypothetical protein